MRPIRSWEEMEDSVEFFVNSADAYHCHFLLLPEYITYQLISYLHGKNMQEMIFSMTDFYDRYLERFSRFAFCKAV